MSPLVSAAIQSAPGNMAKLPVAQSPATVLGHSPDAEAAALAPLRLPMRNAAPRAQASRTSGRRHDLLRGAKPAPKHSGGGQAAALRRCSAPLAEHPSTLEDSKGAGGAPAGPREPLVPHFAKDIQDSPEAEAPSSGDGQRRFWHSFLKPQEDNSRPAELPAFWALNWDSAAEAVETVLSYAQGITLLPQQESEASPGPAGAQQLGPMSLLGQAIEPPQPRVAPASRASPLPFPSQRREALRAELETLELMLRPKCPWPRQPSEELALPEELLGQDPEALSSPSPVSSETQSTMISAAAAAEDSVLYPRCPWPRSTGGAATAPAALYPRSAWPRAPKRVAGQEEAVSAFGELPGGAVPMEALPVGPRCAWPRRITASPLEAVIEGQVATMGCTAPKAPKVVSDAVPSDGLLTASPRCAWPRASKSKASVAAVGAAKDSDELCQPVLGQTSFGAQQVVASGDAAPSANGLVAARNAWPSLAMVMAAVAVKDPPTVAPSSTVESPATVGPRCAWPRVSKGRAVSSEPALAAAVRATPAPRCAWPMASAAAPPTLPSNAAPGPRCQWPRNAAALPAVTDVEPVELGPRCSWPRASATARPQMDARAAAAPKSESEVIEGPRCTWPRKAALTAGVPAELAKAWEVLPAVAVAEASLPCSTPDALSSNHSGSLADSGVLEGPRCPWPRATTIGARGTQSLPA